MTSVPPPPRDASTPTRRRRARSVRHLRLRRGIRRRLRVERQCSSAQRVRNSSPAPAVRAVFFPGLPARPARCPPSGKGAWPWWLHPRRSRPLGARRGPPLSPSRELCGWARDQLPPQVPAASRRAARRLPRRPTSCAVRGIEDATTCSRPAAVDREGVGVSEIGRYADQQDRLLALLPLAEKDRREAYSSRTRRQSAQVHPLKRRAMPPSSAGVAASMRAPEAIIASPAPDRPPAPSECARLLAIGVVRAPSSPLEAVDEELRQRSQGALVLRETSSPRTSSGAGPLQVTYLKRSSVLYGSHIASGSRGSGGEPLPPGLGRPVLAASPSSPLRDGGEQQLASRKAASGVPSTARPRYRRGSGLVSRRTSPRGFRGLEPGPGCLVLAGSSQCGALVGRREAPLAVQPHHHEDGVEPVRIGRWGSLAPRFGRGPDEGAIEGFLQHLLEQQGFPVPVPRARRGFWPWRRPAPRRRRAAAGSARSSRRSGRGWPSARVFRSRDLAALLRHPRVAPRTRAIGLVAR